MAINIAPQLKRSQLYTESTMDQYRYLRIQLIKRHTDKNEIVKNDRAGDQTANRQQPRGNAML